MATLTLPTSYGSLPPEGARATLGAAWREA